MSVPLSRTFNFVMCRSGRTEAVWWVAGVLNMGSLVRRSRMRWSLAAHDICFTNALHSCFFALGKCVPVVRGAGVYQVRAARPVPSRVPRPSPALQSVCPQPAMDFCVERLSRGEWVHIFPEGRVNVAKEHIRFKWGVGRLVADCGAAPLIVPVWHEGMDRVLPNQEPYLLNFRKQVFLNVGEPIQIHHLLDKSVFIRQIIDRTTIFIFIKVSRR